MWFKSQGAVQLIRYIRLLILESIITLCFKSPYPFQAWNGLVVTYKSQRSAKLPSLVWYVSDHRGVGGGRKKQKVTDTSKPVKNVMVFVKDLASAVAAVEHHSWIRCFGSSGEMVNIKGLCRSLPFRRLLTGDLFMTFSKGGGIHNGFPFFESQDNPCHGGGGGAPHTQLQVYKFSVVIRAVQPPLFITQARLFVGWDVIRPS